MGIQLQDSNNAALKAKLHVCPIFTVLYLKAATDSCKYMHSITPMTDLEYHHTRISYLLHK